MDHDLLFQAGDVFTADCGETFMVHGYYYYGECTKPVYYLQNLNDDYDDIMEAWVDVYGDGCYEVDRA